jgi:hypothetical protein
VRVRRTGDRRRRGATSLPIRRMAGWAGMDGNPLRRGIDRVERGLWIVLAVAFFIAVPVVVPLAGNAARVDNTRMVVQERSWREVKAEVLAQAPGRSVGYSSVVVWVAGRWPAPSGGTKTGLVPVTPGTRAGVRVPIWVDRAGHFTGIHPITIAVVTFRVILAEIFTAIGLAMAGLALAFGVRWLMNRRRMAYWAIEWACFGPRWSARH